MTLILLLARRARPEMTLILLLARRAKPEMTLILLFARRASPETHRVLLLAQRAKTKNPRRKGSDGDSYLLFFLLWKQDYLMLLRMLRMAYSLS